MAINVFPHLDKFSALYQDITTQDKLKEVHKRVRAQLPCVDRIAIALHDDKTDLIKTFISRNVDKTPLEYYDATLSDSQSLKEIVDNMRPRVVNDLSIFDESEAIHARKIKAGGFGSSYTLPILHKGKDYESVSFYEINGPCRSGINCFNVSVSRAGGQKPVAQYCLYPD